MSKCRCDRIGAGVQLFRIRDPNSLFDVIKELDSGQSKFITARSVWKCKQCGDLFAYLKIPYKDEEEIIVRATDNNPSKWDWTELVDLAGSVRWRGPKIDERWVV